MSTAALRQLAPEPTADALADVTGFRLRRLHGQFLAHWARWARERDLPVTPFQGGVLLLIDENPGMTQIALARLLRVEAPTLQQALNGLVAAGLVDRYRSPKDGRAIALHLSRSGRSIADRLRTETAAQERELLAGLSDDEHSELNRLLDKALAAAEQATRS